jgi:hypothetical protein
MKIVLTAKNTKPAIQEEDCGQSRGPHLRWCPLAVSDARLALSNFCYITIGIANVAADLAVLVL